MITTDSIKQAERRIQGKIVCTPTVHSVGLTESLERPVFLKLENLQHAGSFKSRGVLNKLLSLSPEQLEQKMVAVSGGNFGIALAEAGAMLEAEVTIVLPRSAPLASADRIAKAGGTVVWEPTVVAAFARADELAEEGNLLIDDCHDPLIAAGSGTLALELHEAQPDVTDVFVSVGGGSMISGVATVLKSVRSDIRIWGVESKGADSMAQAVAKGRPVEVDITSAISTLGVPTVSKFFLEHVQALVHQMIVVKDSEAFDGTVELAEVGRVWAEPAAGSLVAAVRQVSDQLPNDAIVGLVVCGGNATFESMISWNRSGAKVDHGP